jgi:Ser-tRNA(Ala) deacylase AlaX
LYQHRGDLRTYRTKIHSIQLISALPEVVQLLFKGASPDDIVIITDETIFHAQGGGQPSDVGFMILEDSSNTEKSRFFVSSVRRGSQGLIMHHGKFDPMPISQWEVGTKVEQTIDSEKRHYHSRLHTGGHLLGLAVRQIAGDIPNFAETKASHVPGAASVEFQGLIEESLKEPIQARLEKLIEQALDIKISWMDDKEMKEHQVIVDGGFKVGPEGKSRVVEIGEFGGYPCGGTHVTDTKAIGRVVIKKIARKKGQTKISYDVA